METAASVGFSVQRHIKGVAGRITLAGVRAQAAYVQFFAAVDRNDRDSADYSTSFRSNRYYLRIFCWALDRVIHVLFCIVVFCATSDIGNVDWKDYLDKNEGRREFQIDLALSIMNYGLSLDWDDDPAKQPDYVRGDAFTPCDCEKCFFCIHGLTSGVAHAGVKRKAVFHYQCGGRLVTKGCTEERVDSGGTGSSYCRMCYRNAPGTLSAKDKRKLCKTSRLGYNQCRETICEVWWEQGYLR